MSGFDLAREARKLRAGLKVLYMSGYTDHHVKGDWPADETTGFIEKPFTAALLIRRVREALNGHVAVDSR